jgi:hypothetical protein
MDERYEIGIANPGWFTTIGGLSQKSKKANAALYALGIRTKLLRRFDLLWCVGRCDGRPGRR